MSESALEDRAWLELFANCYMEDTELAHRAATLWYHLLIHIESGEEGIRQVREFLQQSIRFSFEYTAKYRECRAEFESSLEQTNG